MFCTPESVEQVRETLQFLRKEQIPFFLLGKGSNVLVGDQGFAGVILHLGTHFDHIRVEGKQVVAGAGVSLAAIARRCLEEGLTGFEFAAGIPGSLGGAVVMNAGAYGGQMADVVVQVTAMDETGDVCILPREALEFGYRNSIFLQKRLIVLEAVLEFAPGDREQIAGKMQELAAQRREKQPLEYPSAGSTFKRPEGYFAGKLVMDAGLRGYQIGGARISEKHCGFIINADYATARDVQKLIEYAQQEVLRQFGVRLEPEVQFLGMEASEEKTV